MAESSQSETNVDTELTMCDVLQEEQELEEDANAVLGASDDTNCSYDDGYVPRQALYACTTCSANGEPAGICLACCYACHDGHEVVELYTKRNFRCDCGNSKFNGKRCNLRPEKEPLNANNKYNQNFKGLYCSCNRPYPDLDDNIPDEMIQCVICEDWYHGRHLGKVPGNEDYAEMVCAKCMDCHKFLYVYLSKSKVEEQSVNGNIKTEFDVKHEFDKTQKNEREAEGDIDVEKVDNSGKTSVAITDTSESKHILEHGAIKPENRSGSVLDIKKESTAVSASTSSEEKCVLNELQGRNIAKLGTAFFPENWRQELCRCSKCVETYEKSECLFLLNLDDTIHAYEEKGKCHSNESQYDKGLSALGQLDRVKQMEAIRAYTNMKGKLKEYLKEFADNKRTVCESDIKEFFDRMNKRQRLNNGVPHFCR